MPISIACPGCQQRLKLGDGLVGKRVRCPKCQHAFQVPAAEDQQHVQKASPPKPRPVRPAEPLIAPFADDDHDRERPRRRREREDPADSRERDDRHDPEGAPRRRKRKSARQPDNKLLYWAVGLGGGLLVLSLGCCGGGLWYFSKGSSGVQGHVNVAQAPKIEVVPDGPQPAKQKAAASPQPANEGLKDPPVFNDKVNNEPPQIVDNPPPPAKPKPPKVQPSRRVFFVDQGFSFEPPKGWVDIPAQNSTFMHKAAPLEFMLSSSYPADERQFAPNVNALSVPNDGTPFDAMRKQIKAELPKQFKNWRLIDDAVITIDGKKTYRIASHFTNQANGVTMDLHLVQYCVFGSNNKIYIVSYGAGPKGFVLLRATFEASAQTIEVD